jgi:hypothetical protein
LEKINGVIYDNKTNLPIPFASVSVKNGGIGIAQIATEFSIL